MPLSKPLTVSFECLKGVGMYGSVSTTKIYINYKEIIIEAISDQELKRLRSTINRLYDRGLRMNVQTRLRNTQDRIKET